MVNYYNKHLFISKAKLAELAGVSDRTFCRYLRSRQHILEAMGVSRKAQLLPPQAVKYVCEDYCIDLPSELQDQRILQSHQLYQKVIRELQLTTFFDGKWTKITEIPPDF
jgi:hypothetical protein